MKDVESKTLTVKELKEMPLIDLIALHFQMCTPDAPQYICAGLVGARAKRKMVADILAAQERGVLRPQGERTYFFFGPSRVSAPRKPIPSVEAPEYTEIAPSLADDLHHDLQ